VAQGKAKAPEPGALLDARGLPARGRRVFQGREVRARHLRVPDKNAIGVSGGAGRLLWRGMRIPRRKPATLARSTVPHERLQAGRHGQISRAAPLRASPCVGV